MATQANQSAVVVNMAPLGDSASVPKPTKKQDTLFGPNIGIVTAGPDWTEANQEKPNLDELTPEIVKIWVAKSKETSQPTTTLQALVNLKRPTLRLSPIVPSKDTQPNPSDAHNHAHALEFEYDCDAPKCGIHVYVVLSPGHPLAKSSDGNNPTKMPVFETVADGGFGNVLKLEEGAVLELGEFERSHDGQTSSQSVAIAEEPGSNGEGHQAEASAATGESASSRQERKKRFNTFHFRKQHGRDHSVAGPALAVVDAEVGAAAAIGVEENGKKDDEGVKVIIKLAALDEDGHGLTSVNEQVTYLHVIRMGNHSADEEEDKRPWVVQVVKREATIGPHTFHLHEIYGLSSHGTQPTNSTNASTSPTSTEAHTYPPPPTTPTVANDEPSSECLLCLSSPREVVLLPCRHLVACRECAVNMVEYGAGGNIVHADTSETTQATAVGGATAGEESANVTQDSPGADTPTPAPQPRRKRRAKGWFCPVCRQPYTSLLRITTTLPSKAEHDSEEEDENEYPPTRTEAPGNPATVATATSPPSRLAALAPPRFFRGLSRTRPEPQMTTPSDLERGLRVSAPTAA